MSQMTRTSVRPARRLLPAVGAAVLLLLTACASGEPAGESSTTESPAATEPTTPAALTLTAGSSVIGLPDDVDAPPVDAVAGAGRTSDPALLHVVTFGSSTCPSVPDPTATSTGAGVVEVTFPEPADGVCTQDYVPATTVVALPDDVDAASDLTVTIGTWGEAMLPAGSDEPVWVLGVEG
ncbi:hypothetical protein [Cellulomonas sp. Marseille-Q8402]